MKSAAIVVGIEMKADLEDRGERDAVMKGLILVAMISGHVGDRSDVYLC